MLLDFMAYKEQFARRGMALVDKIMELRMLNIQAERLSDIVLTDREPEFNATVNTETLEPSLLIKDISFKYGDGEPWVLRNFDLKVNPGESVAIIGSSGCGKTTLLKLMLGLAQPIEGDIEYGGASLQGISSDDYRDLIGVVMQDDQLFSGSVAENISFFTPEADQEWIENCAKTAAIHNEIMAMPMGYHSLVGDMGTTLSGGQKQRILLARALYKKPKMLFLDEATSHLDVVNEAQVNNMVRQLGITTIIIAHRPETIRMADRVILVEQGRAVEIGKEILSTLIGSTNKEPKTLSA
jgi:ATP-binding cassette subfamily B protein RaxB